MRRAGKATVWMLAWVAVGWLSGCGDEGDETLTAGTDSPAGETGETGADTDTTTDTGTNTDTASPACLTDAPAAPGLVIIDSGPVQGVIGDGVTRWLGVPFASPPVGALRFRPPTPPACFTEVFAATKPAPACLQKSFAQTNPTQGTLEGQEDCLYLNVWAPQTASTQSRAVMVFIHGGGNQQGSAWDQQLGQPLYDGADLAERGDVIVVTIQYRLGLFGFPALPEVLDRPDYAGEGNAGTLDQIAALQWVQRNIAAFGGDPERVMVFGESAGGINTCALFATPLAEGLFQRALMQSGACLASPRAAAVENTDKYLDDLQCGTVPDRLACLDGLTDAQLIAPLKAPLTGGRASLGFGPVIDGVVLSESPLDAIRAGRHNAVPFIVGANADETAASVPEGSVNAQKLNLLFAVVPEPERSQLKALYPAGTTDAEARVAYIQATTDAQFVCPARTIARAAAGSQTEPVWRYFFTQAAASAFGGAGSASKGAFHGLELFYVFTGVERMLGGLFATPADETVVERMMDYWSSFARTGDPNLASQPNWPRYDVATDPFMEIAATGTAGTGVRTDKCDLWDAGLNAP
jgi:para-nitrobenzyl esterase